MISSSKSGYQSRHPTHIVWFNAMIYGMDQQFVWCGDVDISADADALQAVANAAGQSFYITRESLGWRPRSRSRGLPRAVIVEELDIEDPRRCGLFLIEPEAAPAATEPEAAPAAAEPEAEAEITQ